MGVCFFENGSFFYENGSLFFRKWQFVFSCVTCSVTWLFPAVACLDRYIFKNGSLFFENGSLFFSKMGVCFTKMGVCFFENGSLFFSKMGVRFLVCDLQCDLLNSGRRLSRPMSVALSGYTLVTVLFN